MSPTTKTIDTGQSVTISDDVLRRYLAGHVLVVAGRRDDFVDHGLPDRHDDVHGHRDRRAGATQTASSTITVNPALSCSAAATKTTIDSGQSTTITDDVHRRHLAGHVRVDAGWRDDFVDHGLPDHDDDVHGDRHRRDGCDADGSVDDHGQPGAVVLGRRRRRRRLTRGQSVTISDTCSGGTSPTTYAGRRVARRRRRSRSRPTATTTYTVTATDGPARRRRRPSTITVNPVLACTVSPASQTIHTGRSVTLTAKCTGGTPADTYSWSPGGATTPSITVSPTVDDDLHGHGDGCDRRDGDGLVGDHGEQHDVVCGVAAGADDPFGSVGHAD